MTHLHHMVYVILLFKNRSVTAKKRKETEEHIFYADKNCDHIKTSHMNGIFSIVIIITVRYHKNTDKTY